MEPIILEGSEERTDSKRHTHASTASRTFGRATFSGMPLRLPRISLTATGKLPRMTRSWSEDTVDAPRSSTQTLAPPKFYDKFVYYLDFFFDYLLKLIFYLFEFM